MAHAALISIAQTIDIILNYHQDSISPQVKNQIISIYEYVIFLQAFLEDFPDKASSFEAIIRKVTHVAEDIIELFMSKRIYEPRCASLHSSVGQLKSQFEHEPDGKYDHHDFPDKDNSSGRRNIAETIKLLFSGQIDKSRFASLESSGQSKSKLKHQPKKLYEHLRCDFHELKEATEEIESIAEIVMKIRNRIIVKYDAPLRDSTAVSSSSRVAPVHKDAMVGFDDDVMQIKSQLCGESFKREVIPVVGMGGIGKTTLARNVYNDPLIMEHFDIRVWVTVSQDYCVQEIVSCLLISLKLPDAKNESMNKHHVYQNLTRRRYLIVLDDMWSIEAWDDLKMMFPDDGNGSRILLTTRLSDVASYANSSPVHEMRLLDEDQSWNLLRQKVFKQDPCPFELENIGEMIATSCRGLPLAIVAISGILSSVDETEAAWWNIARNVKSAISKNDEQFDKILTLSYRHLPHHLRPCFLYMGGFPEDYEMCASRLIKLWAAEGFLKPHRWKSFEVTAEEYLEDLVKRNLVLVTKRKSSGRIKSFSMHDLMREMCIRKGMEEKFFLHGPVSLPEGINVPRRVSIIHFDRDYREITIRYSSSDLDYHEMFNASVRSNLDFNENVYGSIRSDLDFQENIFGSTIRTILNFGDRGEPAPFQYFRLLRVLDLLGAYNNSLPAEVFELFHLRYLAFNGLFIIPAAISNLRNLQTLIVSSYSCYEHLSYCPNNFVPFPLEIWSMPQLRHLDICSGFYFCLPPLQEGATFCLENLQTLSLAINFISTPEILKTIPSLKKLEISYSACRNHEEDYQLHNLIYLQQLENLKLKIHAKFPSLEKVNPAFPRTLKKLTLTGLELPWEDMEIVGSLPNLEVLKLRDNACIGDTWETTDGEFSHLKFLLIDESELQYWITESSHFPRLQCLVLHRCWYLSEIPEGIGEVPTLELIEVDDKFLLNSAKKIQDDQRSCGNDALQVRLVKVS